MDSLSLKINKKLVANQKAPANLNLSDYSSITAANNTKPAALTPNSNITDVTTANENQMQENLNSDVADVNLFIDDENETEEFLEITPKSLNHTNNDKTINKFSFNQKPEKLENSNNKAPLFAKNGDNYNRENAALIIESEN
jgi:hypothetical protein